MLTDQRPPTKSALIVLVLLLTAGSLPAAAATSWFVRVDGGDASQCTGQRDAPYPGSGIQQSCAWNHPFIALPPGGPARIQGGDTLHIGAGSYRMGLGAPGTENCHASWSWDCYMVAVPSGPSEAQKTRILGAGHDAACPNPPELWGTERASMVFNLQGSSQVEVACLEITDRESCILFHCHGGNCPGEVDACNRDGPPFGDYAGAGIKASDSNHVLLRDINIHGMAHSGIHGGRLHDWVTERLTLRANGWVGWDGDLGDGGSSDSGNMTFRELEIAWNGCGERYPSGEIFGCWAQQTGGYGDGMGNATTNANWLFEDSYIHHNTSDGLDLLYVIEGSSITVRRSRFEGNAGNQLKIRGHARIENSIFVGNCAYFEDHPNMFDGDNCRAMGNALEIGMYSESRVEVVNNTITGQGDCLIGSHYGSSEALLLLANNLLLGEIDWRQPWERSCAHFQNSGDAQVIWSNNFVSGVKNGSCPADSLCSGSPMIANDSLASFAPEPLAGSPLIGAADPAWAPALDYLCRPRNAESPDIGAYEYGSGEPPGCTLMMGDLIFRDSFD